MPPRHYNFEHPPISRRRGFVRVDKLYLNRALNINIVDAEFDGTVFDFIVESDKLASVPAGGEYPHVTLESIGGIWPEPQDASDPAQGGWLDKSGDEDPDDDEAPSFDVLDVIQLKASGIISVTDARRLLGLDS